MVVWIHAAVGLYSWLVLKPVWKRIGGLVLPVLFADPGARADRLRRGRARKCWRSSATDPAWRAYITREPATGRAGDEPARCAAGAHPRGLRPARGGRRRRCSAGGMLRDRAAVTVAYDEGFPRAGGAVCRSSSSASPTTFRTRMSARRAGAAARAACASSPAPASLSPRNETERETLARVARGRERSPRLPGARPRQRRIGDARPSARCADALGRAHPGRMGRRHEPRVVVGASCSRSPRAARRARRDLAQGPAETRQRHRQYASRADDRHGRGRVSPTSSSCCWSGIGVEVAVLELCLRFIARRAGCACNSRRARRCVPA